MITEEKLRIFERYDGDVDDWQRRGSIERELISDQDWIDIAHLRHRLWLQKHVPVAPEFIVQTEALLQEKVADRSVVTLLSELI